MSHCASISSLSCPVTAIITTTNTKTSTSKTSCKVPLYTNSLPQSTTTLKLSKIMNKNKQKISSKCSEISFIEDKSSKGVVAFNKRSFTDSDFVSTIVNNSNHLNSFNKKLINLNNSFLNHREPSLLLIAQMNRQQNNSVMNSHQILSSSNFNISHPFDLSPTSRSRSISNFIENVHSTVTASPVSSPTASSSSSSSSSSASSKCSSSSGSSIISRNIGSSTASGNGSITNHNSNNDKRNKMIANSILELDDDVKSNSLQENEFDLNTLQNYSKNKNSCFTSPHTRELIYSRSASNLLPTTIVPQLPLAPPPPISHQPVSTSGLNEKISNFELRNYVGGISSTPVGSVGITSQSTSGKYLEPEQITNYARQTLGSASPYDRRRQIYFDQNIRLNRQESSADQVDGLVAMLSAFYCKILVVIGLCFPMAEVISHRIPIGWYEGFYLFLYTGSILFLLFVYIFLLNRKRKPFTKLRFAISKMVRSIRRSNGVSTPTTPSCADDCDTEASNKGSDQSSELIDDTDSALPAQCGSFYLRVGAVAFGVGSMIYSGLEFGQFFELESKEHCYTIIYGLTPGLHMIFTFFQLYFIFMNSRVIIARHKLIARFGLMHMIATNICVWLHVLIQETKHQIMTMITTNNSDTNFMDHVEDMFEEKNEDYFDFFAAKPHKAHMNGEHQHITKDMVGTITHEALNNNPFGNTVISTTISPLNHDILSNISLHRTVRSLNEHAITHSECRRSNIIGELVTDASQFLFPCTIEYSLICAAILYIMWKGHRKQNKTSPHPPTSSLVHQKHHYQVDCAKAHKGLFTGILLMVICIISLILFFVFIKKEQYRNLAVFQAHFVELFIYCITAIAAVIAFFQTRELDYNQNSNVALDNILLMSAQTGLCIFTMFSIIGAQFDSQSHNTRLVLINAAACLIQSTLQSVFILDASKRRAKTADQMRRKPGREMVTFLLVCNFSMWAINTLETRRADSKPVQLQFFGFWAWTIISHVTMPLTIFYRFHSTVCLCEVWKSTYKIKSEFI